MGFFKLQINKYFILHEIRVLSIELLTEITRKIRIVYVHLRTKCSCY